MHIVLIANYEPDKQESMLRYAAMLESGLVERGIQVTVLRPVPLIGKINSNQHGLGKWLGYIDKFIVFPLTLRGFVKNNIKAIYHICDHSNAMYTAHLQEVRHVVTCHDLLAVRSAKGDFFQVKVSWTGKLLQAWILRGLKRSQSVICDSEATRTDLLSVAPLLNKKSKTVYLGLNHPYEPRDENWIYRELAAHPEVMNLGVRGFIFHVGGNQWYKNRAGVLNIYFEYIRQGGQLPLVLAGKRLPAELKVKVKSAPFGAVIYELGSVSNAQLNALYCRSACLFFPSLFEGFGWPVLEAMASGCVVVCSNRASLPEVGGQLAVYVDPTVEQEAATILKRTVDSSVVDLENIMTLNLKHSATFSNQQMLSELVEHYQSSPGN